GQRPREDHAPDYRGGVDTEDEQPLEGGNATEGVVRVGDTVRKPWGPTTPAVHELMRTVAGAGVDVPEPRGRDARGRQILEFVPGTPALEAPPLTLCELARVGRLIRSIHDASEGFSPSIPAPWEPLLGAPDGASGLGGQCDPRPGGIVLGERCGFIAGGDAAPCTRRWVRAYAAQAFALNVVSGEPPGAARRLAGLVDGYGADAVLRSRL